MKLENGSATSHGSEVEAWSAWDDECLPRSLRRGKLPIYEHDLVCRPPRRVSEKLLELLGFIGDFVHSGQPFTWEDVRDRVARHYVIAKHLLWTLFQVHFLIHCDWYYDDNNRLVYEFVRPANR